nr:ParB N-terminal domain-containing protein [Acidithiobacillus thiooxidans]
MMDSTGLIILPEIEDLLYPLKPEELANLEASILNEGVRDALMVWEREHEKILVDGHHRYAIAQKHHLELKTISRHFDSLDAVLDWVDKNQLGRRNLTDEERALTLGRIYQRVRDHRSSIRANSENTEEKEQGRTADKVAEEWNLSSGTVKRSSDFASAIALLKSCGESGEVAATRVLKGEIKDAMTELPAVYKSHPENFQALADGLADGARKVREVFPKPKPKIHTITPSVGVESENNQPTESTEEMSAYRQVMAGTGMGGEDDDAFFDSVEKAAAATQELRNSEPSPIEIQSNILQCFVCFDLLKNVEPDTLWETLPKYIKEQVQPSITEAAEWFAKLSHHINGA